MEVCGGQTHAIAQFGLPDLLPKSIELIHGPGCPVCVTSQRIMATACHLAQQPDLILCTFGDMLRVPSQQEDLLQLRAKGAQVHIIYSPLEAITLAQQHPKKEVVLFAIGFETTAPAHAKTIALAKELQLVNFSALLSLVRVPPAIEYILKSPFNLVQGFLAAGHVCSIMGNQAYHSICHRYHIPIIVTGFEPVDILQGIFLCVKQLEAHQAYVENPYARVVPEQGNPVAQALIQQVFCVCDTQWRGIGWIKDSGFEFHPNYQPFNALYKFKDLPEFQHEEGSSCISGEILQGQKKPFHCPHFAKGCTPENPLGAPMVSSEGACRAYYLYSGE